MPTSTCRCASGATASASRRSWITSSTATWSALFGAPADRLRSVFLGDPAAPDAGIVELVQFPGGAASGPGPATPPRSGFFLVSCFVDVDRVLARLHEAGLGGPPRRIAVPGAGGAEVRMATVVDPDGVLVELIGIPAAG